MNDRCRLVDDIKLSARSIAEHTDWRVIDSRMVVQGRWMRRTVKARPIPVHLSENTVFIFHLDRSGTVYEGSPERVCAPTHLLVFPEKSLAEIYNEFSRQQMSLHRL